MQVFFRIVWGSRKYMRHVYQTSLQMGIFFKVGAVSIETTYWCAQIWRLKSVNSRLIFNLWPDIFVKTFSLILKVKITHRCLIVWKTFRRKNKISFWGKNGSIDFSFHERNSEILEAFSKLINYFLSQESAFFLIDPFFAL